jgi:hypothetical protein
MPLPQPGIRMRRGSTSSRRLAVSVSQIVISDGRG